MDSQKSLSDTINTRIEKQGPGHFFPASQWSEIMTRPRIQATLRSPDVAAKLNLSAQEEEGFTSFILDKAKTIFAGVVMLDKPWLIRSFKTACVCL